MSKLMPKKRYSDDEIKVFLQSGMSHYKISKIYHVSPKRVTRISRNETTKGPGSYNKLSNDHIEYIKEIFYMTPTLTIEKGRKLFYQKFNRDISAGKVSEILNADGFKYGPPLKVQKLTLHQIILRYNFAYELLDNYDENDPFWGSIIFTDESKFSCSPDSILLWKKKGDIRKEVQAEYIKYPPSAMIWGAIGVGFKSSLVFLNKHVTAESYIQFLDESDIYSQIESAYQNRPYIFQQDGATAHTAESTMNVLQKRLKLLIGWPPNSPDLSPIEMIWSIMKQRISHSDDFPSTSHDLKRRIQEEWDALNQDMINELVMSFRDRLLSVKKVNGLTISHFLSKGMKSESIPSDPTVYTPILFNPETDALMLQYYNEMGRRWKAISQLLPVPHPPQVVKFRILCLISEHRMNKGKSAEEPTLDTDDDETIKVCEYDSESSGEDYADDSSTNDQPQEISVTNLHSKGKKTTCAFDVMEDSDEIIGNDSIVSSSDEVSSCTSSHEVNSSSSDENDLQFFLNDSSNDDIILTSE